MKKKPPLKSYDELTTKQQRFVDYYDGNATQAAEKAGYKNAGQVGHENMRKLDVVNALRLREDRKRNGHIATREERQKFWTQVTRDEEEDMKHRLKASEHLGRSEADFTDNLRHAGKDGEDLNWNVTVVKAKGDNL